MHFYQEILPLVRQNLDFDGLIITPKLSQAVWQVLEDTQKKPRIINCPIQVLIYIWSGYYPVFLFKAQIMVHGFQIYCVFKIII